MNNAEVEIRREADACRAAVVVPCYNEAARLRVPAFRDFLRAHPGARLVLVNDGSTDATVARLGEIREGHEDRVEVLSLARNAGKAEAVRQGVLLALQGPAPYAAFWDADLATPLEMVPRFSAILDGRPDLQMVFGARVKLLGRSVERLRRRHYTGRIFATVASMTLDLSIYDTQCGAKMFRAGPALQRVMSEPFLTSWIFDVEIIARFLQLWRRDGRAAEDAILEYPLERWQDVRGSKLKATDYARAARDLWRVYRTYRRHELPALASRRPTEDLQLPL